MSNAEDISKIISEKLLEIEKKENVRIIHAVESGSRAWGFASSDSDYDVRFIYVRTVDDYLRLDEKRDVIEWQLDDTLDINGWDIAKALRLLHKSNPTIFEWNASPIIYKTTPQWKEISEVINHYFQQKCSLYHYLNMARSNYREYLQGESVRLKKYFYVLRPVLACRWMLERKSPPPMLFTELAASTLDSNIMPEVNCLLRIKTETPELGEGKKIDAINDYLKASIAEIEELIKVYPKDEPASYDKLNRIFLNILK